MKDKKSPDKELSPVEKAKMILHAESEKKRKDCVKELNVILEKYDFALETTPSQIVLTPRKKPRQA